MYTQTDRHTLTWKLDHVICRCVHLVMTPSQQVASHIPYTDHVIHAAPAVQAGRSLTDYERPVECRSA